MERRRIRFDTHAVFKKFVAAGIPRRQGDAYVCLFVRLIGEKVASDIHLDEPSPTAQRGFRFDTRAAAEELVAAGFPPFYPDLGDWLDRSLAKIKRLDVEQRFRHLTENARWVPAKLRLR